DITGDVHRIADATDHHRSRLAAAGRHQAVVAVVESLVGQGDAAAAVVAAQTDPVVRQICHPVDFRVRPLPLDRGVTTLIGGVVIVGEMAGSATAAVAATPDLVRLQADMTQGAKLAVEFAGEMIQLTHTGQLDRLTFNIESFQGLRAVKRAVLPLPGE